jgi:hypothetical protein
MQIIIFIIVMEEIYVNVDSRYRDLSLYPNESKFKINLNSYYKNISKIKLTSIELPNLDYLPIIDPSKKNNNIIFTLPNTPPLTISLPYPLLNSELISNLADPSANSNFICNTINSAINDFVTANSSSPYAVLQNFKCYYYNDPSNKYKLYNNTSVYNKIILYYSTASNYPSSNTFSSSFDTAIFNGNTNSNHITVQFNINQLQMIQPQPYLYQSNNIVNETNYSSNFNNSSINNKSYPSLGYYMGFRKNSYVLTMGIPVIAEEHSYFDIENYVFIKLNEWGYVDHFNNKMFAKILLNSNTGDVLLNEFNTKEYIIKQPINIQTLYVELVDYLGNPFSTGGKDFSFTLQLSQILNSDNKRDIEYNFLNKKLINNI